MKTFEHGPRDSLTDKDVNTFRELAVVHDSLASVKLEVAVFNDEVTKLIQAIKNGSIEEFFEKFDSILRNSDDVILKNIGAALIENDKFNSVIEGLSSKDKVSFSFKICGILVQKEIDSYRLSLTQ